MKHILMLAATIVIGLSGQAFARLGQTEEKVSALFGKPIDAGTPDKEGVTTNMTRTQAVNTSPWSSFKKVTASPKLIRGWIAGSFPKKKCRSFLREIPAARNG